MSCLQHGGVLSAHRMQQLPRPSHLVRHPGSGPGHFTTQLSSGGCFGSWATANGKNKTNQSTPEIRSLRCYLPLPGLPTAVSLWLGAAGVLTGEGQGPRGYLRGETGWGAVSSGAESMGNSGQEPGARRARGDPSPRGACECPPRATAAVRAEEDEGLNPKNTREPSEGPLTGVQSHSTA